MTQRNQTEVAEVEYKFRAKDGIKRETVAVAIPVPTADAIVAILTDTSDEGKKAKELVLDSVQGIVISYVRGKVDQDENFNQESLNALAEELGLDKIANLPRSERSTVSKELLENFGKAYIALMPEKSGISVKGAEQAASIFVARLKPALGNNDVLAKLQARLTEFVEKVDGEVVAEHEVALNYLTGRIEEALGIDIVADAL